MSPDIEKRITEFARDIGEHCDCVRIFATYPNGDGESGMFSVGNGNIYAQIGAVKEWIIRQEESVRKDERA